MISSPSYRFYSCGDHAVTVAFGEIISKEIHQKVMSLFQQLKSEQVMGVLDIIPAYSTVTVVYDPLLVAKSNHTTAYDSMKAVIENEISRINIQSTQKRLIKIPVCYDKQVAPDINELAANKQLSVEEVISIHTSSPYNVYMIGFLPGFAYMGTVDRKIASPRKEKPRTKVPAGSVGIAGEQTGIYPVDSPGGWQLIGRTPVAMFDASSTSPCYLQPGDEVQFYPITFSEFQQLSKI